MRRLQFLAAVVGSLVIAAVAYAATTKNVSIRSAGFVPDTVTIATGDSVKWTNNDKVNHQVVATGGHFASPVLRPGQSYTRRFDEAGTYRYRDSLEPAETGRVVVSGPPPSVSIAASTPVAVFGSQVSVGGRISSGKSGEQVTVYGRKYGEVSYVQLGVVLTGDQGAWSYAVTPELLSSYQAQWKNLKSAEITVAVQPKLTLKRIGGWFVVRVDAARSFKNRWVYVQRRSSLGQWVNLRKVVIGTATSQRFKVEVPRGLSRLRLFMTVNQAGVGYLASTSNTLLFRRR